MSARSEIAHFSQADRDAVAAEPNGDHHHKHSTKRCDEPLKPQQLCINGHERIADRFDWLEARPHLVGEVMAFGEV